MECVCALFLQIESLGGFKLFHQVEGGEEVVFRFHHKSKLQGGASVTVRDLLTPEGEAGITTDSFTSYQKLCILISAMCTQ